MFKWDKPKPPEQKHNSLLDHHADTNIMQRLPEFARRASSDLDEGDSKVIRDFYEAKKIKSLSEAEKEAKTTYFKGRYDDNPDNTTCTGDGVYTVDIPLKNANEAIYTNSVNFNTKDLQGKYNYANLDTTERILKSKWERDPDSMHLDDIKWQTLRLAIEGFQKDNPERSQEVDIKTFRPDILSGHDIEERDFYRTLFINDDGLKLERNKRYTFDKDKDKDKDIPDFNKVMMTTLGKHYLRMIRKYLSEQTVKQVTIDTGTGKYVKKFEIHLADKKPATPHAHSTDDNRRILLE
jgi:hypothetical protein